jgi:choline dehydrogenase-like flavoprotein
MSSHQPDVVIVGSGMGGATLAYGLAKSGARVLVLERGEVLQDRPECRDPGAIFGRGVFRPNEEWIGADGRPFNPGNYYYVGGNSKFYGAVLTRFRREDFEAIEHADGISPAWPIRYDELEPYYGRAERLFRVRGQLGEDPTEPPHSTGYEYPPVPDEAPIARVRERLKTIGLKPYSLPLGIDLERWLARAPTPWDAFPDTRSGKMDAETALTAALESGNVSIETGAEVRRLLPTPDGTRIAAVEYEHRGEVRHLSPAIVVLSAGAVNSTAILLRSANDDWPNGLANRSDEVGRHMMNHNATAMLAIDPRQPNNSVYQKTLGLNDFYLSDGKGGPPLGNVQLLGKVSGPILKANARAPLWLLDLISRRSVDWYLMSEDLPDPDSRIQIDGGGRIVFHWKQTNMTAHRRLVARMRELFRAAGFPIVLTKAFDRRTPSHQCGTIRFGTDPATSALDPYSRSHDHRNLFVVDASFMPSSAGLNPALTIAAQALRVADHMVETRFAA